jgi:hypothetical protein
MTARSRLVLLLTSVLLACSPPQVNSASSRPLVSTPGAPEPSGSLVVSCSVESTSEALPGVRIVVTSVSPKPSQPAPIVSYTRADGTALISNLPSGRYTVEAALNGFSPPAPAELSITGGTFVAHFPLRVAPWPGPDHMRIYPETPVYSAPTPRPTQLPTPA